MPSERLAPARPSAYTSAPMLAAVNQTAEALVSKIAAGDQNAFEQLYDRHSAVVYALLVRMLRDPEDAKETLQETFIQVWKRAGSYDPARGSEIAWLVQIGRSRALDRIRARKVRDEKETDAGREISIRNPDVEHTKTDERAYEGELRTHVRRALDELPEAQRTALELAYFEGLTQSEIAERLAEPLGTVKTRMQLGMRKLKGSLRNIW